MLTRDDIVNLLPTALIIIVGVYSRYMHPTLRFSGVLLASDAVGFIFAKRYPDKYKKLRLEAFPLTRSLVSCTLINALVNSYLRDGRAEGLYWSCATVWGTQLLDASTMNLEVFDHYYHRHYGQRSDLHGIIVATWITPIFWSDRIGLVQLCLVWFHFYKGARYAIVVWAYWTLTAKEKALAAEVEELRKRKAALLAHLNNYETERIKLESRTEGA